MAGKNGQQDGQQEGQQDGMVICLMLHLALPSRPWRKLNTASSA
jgi:hypothetical protein